MADVLLVQILLVSPRVLRGGAGITQLRTLDIGDVLAARHVQPAEAGVPPSPFHQAIHTRGCVYYTQRYGSSSVTNIGAICYDTDLDVFPKWPRRSLIGANGSYGAGPLGARASAVVGFFCDGF